MPKIPTTAAPAPTSASVPAPSRFGAVRDRVAGARPSADPGLQSGQGDRSVLPAKTRNPSQGGK